jgi:hypothetical protein|tara:strand:- start:187 stop:1185 length:999 start_codon:yes stop_codon:yes gene_type:complete
MIEDMLTGNESILFLGRPGVGKTTVIREIARVLSDELGKRVVIIDTSNEIGGDGDIPHPAIGSARRMQVPDPAQQHQIMIEAVENHMPEVIIVDEIGTEAEAIACRTIAERGVQLVGTAHGQLLENLIKNPTLTDLVGGVQSVTLGDDEARARGCQKTIMERQAPPTFPILIEMHERSMWVAHNVEESVDEVLAGGRPMVQMRSRDQNTGQVRFNRTVYDMDVFLSQKNVAYTLGSMGGLMGATTDLAEARVFGLAEENMANNAVLNAGWSPNDVQGTNDSVDDPYAWAQNLGMVPDKDALEAMGAHGYVGTGKRGNGRQSKRGRQGPRAFR